MYILRTHDFLYWIANKPKVIWMWQLMNLNNHFRWFNWRRKHFRQSGLKSGYPGLAKSWLRPRIPPWKFWYILLLDMLELFSWSFLILNIMLTWLTRLSSFTVNMWTRYALSRSKVHTNFPHALSHKRD